ncbi:hypothetical protein C7974DRAFT_391694 [Boeremia exigua]|uniref:uncharacterized protein n=1 Tax=Boeremia exigua TaxID=749465 RepID=UPI001E8E778C|nr:uncharacterized protein C7974DRAFT_391694 [Boeremia exigua]KAH6638487.1 hypothetical protein C7974DRAFT_391694 [Boeremia exigua]
MQLLQLFLLSAAFPSMIAATPYCPPRAASLQQKRAILQQYIQKLYIDRDPIRAVNDHIALDLIQHNPNALSGRENTLQSLAFISPDTVNFTITHLGVDGDIGFVHSRFDLVGADQPSAVADFFRFNGTCIQEHWDAIQERTENRRNPLDLW